ncbi:TolC family protein [bacterium]|nr:TolC family protein [bacterium]
MHRHTFHFSLALVILAAGWSLCAEAAPLTLGQAISLAVAHHPELAEAEARVRVASALALEAGLYPNPALFARMESAPLEHRTVDDAEFLVGVSQPIPLGGRLRAARKVEALRARQRALEREARALEIARSVHETFVEALHWQEVAAVLREAARIADRGVESVEARVRSGDAVESELAQARIERQRALLQLERAESRGLDAHDALWTAMGQPERAAESPVLATAELPAEVPSLDAVVERARGSALAEQYAAGVGAAEAGVELARKEARPDLELEAGLRHLGAEDEAAFDVGIALPIPLFDRNQGLIRAREAEVEATEAGRRAALVRLERDLRRAHRRMQLSMDQARRFREGILEEAEETLRSIELRYQAGDVNLLAVLSARRDWIDIQLDYLDAERDVMKAWASLSPFLMESRTMP